MNSIERNTRIIALESRFEILKSFRTTSFIIPTLSFPVIFYLFLSE